MKEIEVDRIFEKIDWKLLAEQKIQLFNLIEELSDNEKRNALEAILNIIDEIQDEADKLGFSVVWTDEIQCIHCGGKCPANHKSRSGRVCDQFLNDMDQLDDIIGLG